ncbi:hypothetical protein E2C01_065487 [Portunus trituberculatus]|uniref:Ionotropic glutamate receptor C-terminal domain-containing protein n=1 Tax=Portunus trituberculatus TaxID=210409 RepID=A0A5B7HNI3_PORTR|nr:hypothetical protein [Portunus trituberculatus]
MFLTNTINLPNTVPQLIRTGHGGHPNMGVGTVFQDMVGMLLGQNLPRRLSYTTSSRVLVAAWLVFALILGMAYRGNLTASLTLPKYPPRPETLKEIVDNVEMVTMPSYGKHFRKFYSDSESPLFQILGSLINPGPSLMEGLKMAMVKRVIRTQTESIQPRALPEVPTSSTKDRGNSIVIHYPLPLSIHLY